MIDNVLFREGKATVTYKFTEDELEILKHLKEHKHMEFRHGNNSERIDRLYDYGFVKSDDYAWHFTVILTDLGKKTVEKI